MNNKYLILSLAKTEIEKKLQRMQADVKKKSEKYRQMDMDKVSHTRRREARFGLERACEERDGWERILEETEKWMEEIKK